MLEKSFRNQTNTVRQKKMAIENFQLKQITILYRGALLCILVAVCLSVYVAGYHKSFAYVRNSFGQGEQEITLQLDKDGEKEQLTIILEERQLTGKEEDEIFQAFFQEIKKKMVGENKSLSQVNQSLNFVDSMEGYPFEIRYEPVDIRFIDWSGNLGEEALSLKKGESIKTSIIVQASYKSYMREEQMDIVIIPQKKEEVSWRKKLESYLIGKEEKSRNQETFVLDDHWDGIKISDPTDGAPWRVLVFIVLTILGLLLRNHSVLKEEKEKRQKENMEDFPLIVHLLTLYMGVGLSFSSAVARIAQDYQAFHKKKEERYAFEQICLMDYSLHMGMRPKEVCQEWGNHFDEKIYAKFAMLLSQSFSKGAKEINHMMEEEQEDALQVQLDLVRKEGEEASTKLIFPMIVLLCIIMVMVMFPAMIQFYEG